MLVVSNSPEIILHILSVRTNERRRYARDNWRQRHEAHVSKLLFDCFWIVFLLPQPLTSTTNSDVTILSLATNTASMPSKLNIDMIAAAMAVTETVQYCVDFLRRDLECLKACSLVLLT